MADEPAAIACSIPQTTDENPEVATSQQVSELVDPAIGCEAKAKIEGIESSTARISTPHTQTSQHFRHDSTSYDVLGRTADDSQEHPSVCSHVTNPHEERDLERGEPYIPPSMLASHAADPVTDQPRTERPIAPGRFVLASREIFEKELKGSVPTVCDPSLIDGLRYLAGDNGDQIYRRYALGCGQRKQHGWFVEEVFNKITTASSRQDVWWLTGYFAVFLQHVISRWVHGGHRKHFQTMFCMDTAVYLLQNIGDPSDRWINDTLKNSLGLDPLFFDEHLALVYDGTLLNPRAGGCARHILCPRAWHVLAVLSDEQVMHFSSLETFPATDSVALVCVSFQRTDTDSFIVLFDIETRASFPERCKEFVRGRDTWTDIVLEWLERARSRVTRFQVQSARAVKAIAGRETGRIDRSPVLYILALELALVMVFVFLLWGMRPFNPRGDGFGFVEWPRSKRTFVWKRTRPLPTKAFEFLQDWLSDPVHLKMIAYMTSSTGRPPHVHKLAEEAILWQMSSDSWKHEKNCLSLESEKLERQAIEKPNFSTLKQLVECRQKTRKLQDSIKELHQQMPSMTLDWECAMKAWNHGWHESPERQSHQPHRQDFPPFVSRVLRNPVESYWEEQNDQTTSAERSVDLKLRDIEDSLTRSMSLLQEAIAVQTSDRALWLALIATFYFPATLATGVFGMNLSLIDGKPYWWAIAVCGILFVPNLAFLIYVFGR